MKKKIMLPLIGVMSLLGGLTSCGGGGKSSSTPKPSASSVPATSVAPTTSVAPSTSVAPTTPKPPAEAEYGNGQVSLTIWAPAEQFEQYSLLVNAYNEAQKDAAKTVKLKVVGIGENQVGEKFGNDPSKGPDVFQMPGNNISSFVTKGFISKLDVSGRTEVSITNETLKTGQVKGELYALPYTINTYFLYYNASKIEAAAVSKISTILSFATGTEKAMGVNVGDGFYQQAILRGMGLNLYGEGGTSNSSTDVLKDNEAALKAASIIYECNKNPLFDTAYAGFAEAVKAGTLLTAVDGTWNYKTYKENLGENFGCTVLPLIDGVINGYTYDNQLGSPIDNKFIAINSSLSGAKKTAAEEFVYYVASDAGQKIRYDKDKIIPTADNLLKDPEFKKSFAMADAVSAYYNSTANFSNPTATKFDSNYWNAAIAFSGDLAKLTTWDATKAATAVESFGEALLA